ncbi:MAG: hypothetical protein K2I35_01850, partial [Duncaniella sp.]|nr:hypothetical protein [Duncaniella sp.]
PKASTRQPATGYNAGEIAGKRVLICGCWLGAIKTTTAYKDPFPGYLTGIVPRGRLERARFSFDGMPDNKLARAIFLHLPFKIIISHIIRIFLP